MVAACKGWRNAVDLRHSPLFPHSLVFLWTRQMKKERGALVSIPMHRDSLVRLAFQKWSTGLYSQKASEEEVFKTSSR